MNDPKNTADDSGTTQAERLAIRTGITGDQAQDLIDRIGHGDEEALEAAALELKRGSPLP